MNHDGANTCATRIRIGALFVAVLGVLGLGALYLAGEGVAEWIHARDNVKDPLRKRVWHLALLLAVVVVFWVASAALLSVNQ